MDGVAFGLAGISRSEVGGLQGILVAPDHQGRLSAQQERNASVAFEAGRNAGQSAQSFERIVQVRVQSGVDAVALALLDIVVANLARPAN